MWLSDIFCFLGFVSVCAESPAACPVQIERDQLVFVGKARVVDGDTFWLGIHKIRPVGIEAPEKGQACLKDGKDQKCFQQALQSLKGLVGNAEIRCEGQLGFNGEPDMSHGRYLARCYIGEIDVGKAMVASGWAFATDAVYLNDELMAQEAKLGVHATIIDRPELYRSSQNAKNKERVRETLIKGVGCGEFDKRCKASAEIQTLISPPPAAKK